MSDRVIKTIGECKKLGIWSEVCDREYWNEESIEETWSDDTKIAIDSDLLETE